MIHFDQATMIYRPPHAALKDVSFSVAASEMVVVTGPSGAGKSTLLSMITRELVPTSGRVVVAGRDLTAIRRAEIPLMRRSIGVVFQDFRLLRHRTIEDNISFVLRALAWPAARRRERTRRVLEWVGLAHRANDLPETLSGGEQQRIAIARALAPEPRLLLADEPTGNLDPERSFEILALFREIHARGTCVLLATHDRMLIERAKVRVLTLQAGRLARDEAPR